MSARDVDATGAAETPGERGPDGEGPPWRVRPAAEADVEAIYALVRELAVYEREPHAVQAGVEDFRIALFGPHPLVHAQVAEVEDPEVGAQIAGMALWYVTFSTWRGRHGIWLEDLFVSPRYRRLGLGRALLAELGRICRSRGYPRLEWWVLDWNSPAQEFYLSLGAAPQDEWTVWRLDGTALAELGGG